MRSGTEALAAGLLLLLAGCGDWSNEDLRFYAALPTHAELRVAVPGAVAAATGPGGPLLATAACGPLGDAEAWLWAKPTSDHFNASVDSVLSLVDVVRAYPPTTRLADARVWGPFDDDKHPGVQIRIVITRTWPGGRSAAPLHTFTFEARRRAAVGAFTPLIIGNFTGPSAARGTGTLTLAFDAIRALGMNDDETAPTGALNITYDRAQDPRAVTLSLVQSGGFGLEQFDYAFQGWADGRGHFAYAFRSGAALATVRAGFDASGAGRGLTTLHLDGGFTGQYAQCWDPAACLTWVDDPNDYSCGRAGCSGGAESACPAVPAP